MGGRGSAGGRGGGGGASNIHDANTQNLINRLESNLENVNQKLAENPSYEKTQRLKQDAASIKDQIEYYNKADKIKYINKYGGSDIQEWESYSSKDIDKMFKKVKKGYKLVKLGYEWVVDYNSIKKGV